MGRGIGRGSLLALLLLLLNTTRTRSGPPSTRATITMDGGVADTARANTNNSCEHKPLVGGSWGKSVLLLLNTTRTESREQRFHQARDLSLVALVCLWWCVV